MSLLFLFFLFFLFFLVSVRSISVPSLLFSTFFQLTSFFFFSFPLGHFPPHIGLRLFDVLKTFRITTGFFRPVRCLFLSFAPCLSFLFGRFQSLSFLTSRLRMMIT